MKGVRIDVEPDGTSDDSIRASRALKGASLIVSLGGDGTNRAIAKGWSDAPLLPLSTGTNNAFATFTEPTVAGVASAFIANQALPLDLISIKSKVIHVDIQGESVPELALVDLVGTKDRFVGSRAIVDPTQYLFALLTLADASKVGMVGIGGSLEHIEPNQENGVFLTFNEKSRFEKTVKAAVAPGLIREVNINRCKIVPLSDPLICCGPAVLAFDGERDRYLRPNQQITCTVQRDGPRLFDVETTLKEVTRRGLMQQDYKRVLAHA